ncbi:hypothetical protein OKW21_003026 [Catalinimonas alkaloidigena]|uniref:hypothetical protein n=1 Tax=Catalinimonas alkaloidigena TaxID=1075417 RepID=UPI002405B2FB|nr:hypothetical protein [Catalinimonas alkaloidigena]MDF9797763.1 hypothetical protein [Catalinimonas alkaloidigena]
MKSITKISEDTDIILLLALYLLFFFDFSILSWIVISLLSITIGFGLFVSWSCNKDEKLNQGVTLKKQEK